MNQKAYYGEFGGQYVAESLMNTLEELDKAFEEAIHDPEFMEQYHYYLKQYVDARHLFTLRNVSVKSMAQRFI